jgi:hypothetical protein
LLFNHVQGRTPGKKKARRRILFVIILGYIVLTFQDIYSFSVQKDNSPIVHPGAREVDSHGYAVDERTVCVSNRPSQGKKKRKRTASGKTGLFVISCREIYQ